MSRPLALGRMEITLDTSFSAGGDLMTFYVTISPDNVNELREVADEMEAYIAEKETEAKHESADLYGPDGSLPCRDRIQDDYLVLPS